VLRTALNRPDQKHEIIFVYYCFIYFFIGISYCIQLTIEILFIWFLSRLIFWIAGELRFTCHDLLHRCLSIAHRNCK